MKRYLLDTQAAVWLLTNNKELPENLREEIEYVQSLFHVSYMSIVELIKLGIGISKPINVTVFML